VRSAARFWGRMRADLIEAGLNEGAGRFALTALWVLFAAAPNDRGIFVAPGEARTRVLTIDGR
jgi:hypothetical protein